MINVYKNHKTGNYHAVQDGLLVFVWSPLTWGWLYTEANAGAVVAFCELVASNITFK